MMCGVSLDTWDQLTSSKTSCYTASYKKGECCKSKPRDEVFGNQIDNVGKSQEKLQGIGAMKMQALGSHMMQGVIVAAVDGVVTLGFVDQLKEDD